MEKPKFVDRTRYEDGWQAPTSHAEVWQRFSAKHGDNEYTRALHRKWTQMAHQAGLTWK